MSKRNSQYILTVNGDDSDISFERLSSFFNLQFLNQEILKDIDLSFNNVKEGNYTPTDLAIKTYVQNIDSEIKSNRTYLGEIENYYGIYSCFTTEGINNLIRAQNSLQPSVNVDSNNPLLVKINDKEYSFTSISVSPNGIMGGLFHQTVQLAPNPIFGTEESKYLKEISYININTYGNKKYYIIKIGNEYSTVRVDRVRQKLYFEHPGGADRSQWFSSINSGSVLSDPVIIPAVVTPEHPTPETIRNDIFNLYEIRYVYIRHNEGSDEHSCNLYYYDIDPILITDPEQLRSTGVDCYGYNIYNQRWYRYKPLLNEITEEPIQLVGMVGINIIDETNKQEIVCSYTLPSYFQKAQFNTFKLEKYRDNVIRTKSSSNIINVGNNIIETKQYYYEWIFDARNYRNVTVFLYIDILGNTRISATRPYRNEYGGYYLNNKMWRCVGSVYINNRFQLNEPCDLLGTFNTYEQYEEDYATNTFARFPLNFKGNITLIKTSDKTVIGNYNVKDLNNGIAVNPNTTIKYEGIVYE